MRPYRYRCRSFDQDVEVNARRNFIIDSRAASIGYSNINGCNIHVRMHAAVPTVCTFNNADASERAANLVGPLAALSRTLDLCQEPSIRL